VKVAYFGAATLAMRKAIHEADHVEGVQLIGQSQGLVHDVASVAEIVQRVMDQARSVAGAVNSGLG
jgi:enoyl-[acyl-carrier protein] reductase II